MVKLLLIPYKGNDDFSTPDTLILPTVSIGKNDRNTSFLFSASYESSDVREESNNIVIPPSPQSTSSDSIVPPTPTSNNDNSDIPEEINSDTDTSLILIIPPSPHEGNEFNEEFHSSICEDGGVHANQGQCFGITAVYEISEALFSKYNY